MLQNNKLLSHLNLLSKEEQKAFKAFVAYRLANKKAAIHLIKYLTNPSVKLDKLTQENLIVTLQIDPNLDQKQKLADTFSDLFLALKDFLVYQQLEKQPQIKEKLFASNLADRNNYTLFTKQVKQAIKATEAKIKSDSQPTAAADFLLLNELNELFFFHPETDKFKKEVEELDHAILYLQKYCTLTIFRYVLDYKLRQMVLTKQQDIQFDYFINLTKGFDDPVFDLYLAVFQLYEEHTSMLFSATLTKLNENLSKLSNLDKSILINKLLHEANVVFENGEEAYLHHIFNLFKTSHDNNVILYNNRIGHLVFINVVSVASAVRQFEWAEAFIHHYTPFISGEKVLRQETTFLAKAFLSFFKEEYDNALKVINSIDQPSHFANKIIAETLKIRIYYELTVNVKKNYLDAFDRTSDKLIRYMDREKKKNLSPARNAAIKNFIKFLKTMIDLHDTPDRILVQQLETQIIGTPSLISRVWLLMKLREIPIK